jgi:hypothetical protein
MAGILYNFYDKDYEFTSSVDWSETVYTQVELKTKADNIAISLEHDTFEDLIQYLDIAEGTNYGTRSFEEQVKLLGDYIGLTSYDKMDGSLVNPYSMKNISNLGYYLDYIYDAVVDYFE